MFVLGLTGSIGMGKTTTANMFRFYNVPVYDADEAVHKIFISNKDVVERIQKTFRGVVTKGCIDREKLGKIVFSSKEALIYLEQILHPIVRLKQQAFLMTHAKHRRRLCVLDVPLLFETGGESICDAVAVVTAPYYLQKLRVMSRKGMTDKNFKSIISRQTHDLEKRKRADFIIQTGLGKNHSLMAIKAIIRFTASIHKP